MASSFQDSGLLLVGHGSLFGPDSAAPIHAQADAVRAGGRFGRVSVALWKEEPYVWNCLHALGTRRVLIVPFFISPGYFTDEVVPRELGFPPMNDGARARTMRIGDQTFIYCMPIGTHPSMTDVILARADEVVAEHPFPSKPSDRNTTLFVAGHGTGRNAKSRTAIDDHVAKIAAMNRFAQVHSIFMDEAPTIDRCWELAPARNIVVVPFFISEGLHTRRDIPRMLGEPASRFEQRIEARQPSWQNPTERHGRRLWLAAPVGTHPRIGEVVMSRVEEATDHLQTATPGS